MMREAVRHLISFGVLPDEEGTEEAQLQAIENGLDNISRPVTNEEACALVQLFGKDTYFGLAWSLVHIIETAPDWPLRECLQEDQNEWIALLKLRCRNAGIEI